MRWPWSLLFAAMAIATLTSLAMWTVCDNTREHRAYAIGSVMGGAAVAIGIAVGRAAARRRGGD
jgi:hypothetical protein